MMYSADKLKKQGDNIKPWCTYSFPSFEYVALWYVLFFCLVCFPGGAEVKASFNFMVAITICSDFGAQENKVFHRFHCFSIYFPWSDGTRCHDLVFWKFSFKPAFSRSSFIFIKRLLSYFLLSAIREVSSAYLRLLIFLPSVLNSSLWFIQPVI